MLTRQEIQAVLCVPSCSPPFLGWLRRRKRNAAKLARWEEEEEAERAVAEQGEP